ncbi:MAG: CBS domain-containing protein [Cyanobacteria bacterium]|nr:CBS domain-containing protein [Cyanobacteriota bacterium]
MEIVVTHNSMDFDALAAQFGITRLYPAAKIVLGLPLVGNVREFLTLYRSSLPIVQSKYLDLNKVSRIFVVDCQHIERLDETLRRHLTSSKELPEIILIDHHKKDPEGLSKLASANSMVQAVGAATTLVVDQMRKRKMKLTPFEATLLALGIYEDTGCLTYSGTTELDAKCIAYLLKQGVDLEQVNSYIRPKLTEEQVHLLEELVKNAKVSWMEGAQVILSSTKTDTFIDGLAGLTRKLLEIMSCDAVFCAVHMKDRIHLVGRSDSHSIDVQTVVRRFGGDGHPGAGSAVVRGRELRAVLSEVKAIIAERVKPESIAQDIMTTPVRTIRPSSSMDEASRLMIRYAQDGLIVAEGDEVVGVVSRRDIDQAIHHRLGHAPVQGFMSRPVISVAPGTGLSEIQHIMVREDIGRLPVLDEDNHLIGVVSRKNVLKTLYGDYAGTEEGANYGESEETIEHFLPKSKSKDRNRVFKDQLATLSLSTQWLCKQVGEVAAHNNMVAYAVGGFVRDLFLHRDNFDLDFVVEGNAIEMADRLEREYPSRFEVVARHERFQTATLTFRAERIREVDLSTARTEYYDFPAALPTVEPSMLEHDLSRRDFTINSLAICLNPGRYGELVDPYDGLEDLKRKTIRILHPFSFIEDPTRILRAARFGARLGFHLEPKSKERARRAMLMGIFDELGGVRIRDEIRMILESEHRLTALDLLEELGGCLRFLDSTISYGLRTKTLIRRAERLLTRYPVSDAWIVYLGLLIADVSPERMPDLLDRLHLANSEKRTIAKGLSLTQDESLDNLFLPRSEVYHKLKGKTIETLAIAACLAPPMTSVRRMINLYLKDLIHIKNKLTGYDLVSMGVDEGPAIGQVLGELLDRRLDGTIDSEDGEREFVLNRVHQLPANPSQT